MFDFGILQPYVDDKEITDIDSNSKTVYVTHQYKGTYKVANLPDGYLSALLKRLCNAKEINEQFNYENPILDGEIDGLRIHAEHSSFVTSGDTLNIRKNPLELVITEEQTDFAPQEVFDFLRAAARAKMSVIFGGEVGSGKTQAMKTFLTYTDPTESIVFISDIDEMRMTELYPERNYRQCIVNDIVDYTKATASILRDNPAYVCFQEVRDSAVDALFLALSGSSRVTSSLHVKNALLMPQRLIQLSDNKNDKRLLSTIHDYVQICVVPYKEIKNGLTRRFIGEIAVFWNEENEPRKQLIYECYGNNPHLYALPKYFQEYFDKNGVKLKWSEEK